MLLVRPDRTIMIPYGDGVTLTCVAHGSPIPDITWFREGDQQIDNQTSNVVLHEGLIELANLTFVESIIRLCPVDMNDIGEYNCYANNSIGNDSFVFQVRVIQGMVLTVLYSL